MSGATIETPSYPENSLFPGFIASEFDEKKAVLKKFFNSTNLTDIKLKIFKPPDDDRFSVDSFVIDFQSMSSSLSKNACKHKKLNFPGTPPGLPPSSKSLKSLFPGKPPGRCPPSKVKLVSNICKTSIDNVPKPPSGVKGKQVSWKSIPVSKISGSIWASFSENESEMYPLKKCGPDFMRLASCFFEVEEVKAPLTKPRSTSFSDTLTDDPRIMNIVSAKRRQNVEICMKGLGLLDNIEPLIKTLSLGDPDPTCKVISPENLQLIISVYPTEEEQKLLQQHQEKFKHDKTFKLGKVERFMLELMKIKFLKEKIECLMVRKTFEEDLTSLGLKITRYQKCLQALISSIQNGALKMLLYVVLQTGNYLNSGTKKGLAAGFTIDSLFLLKTIKSCDDTTNLLRELVNHFNSLEFCKIAFWEDLQHCLGLCQCAYITSYEDLKTVNQQLELKFKKVEFLIHGDLSSDTNFQKSFNNFLITTKLQLNQIKTISQNVESNFKVLLNLLAHTPNTIPEGVEMLKKLNRFWKELLTARMELCKKKSMIDIFASKKGSLTARSPTVSSPNNLKKEAITKFKTFSFNADNNKIFKINKPEYHETLTDNYKKPTRRSLSDLKNADPAADISNFSSFPKLCTAKNIIFDNSQLDSSQKEVTTCKKTPIPHLNLKKIVHNDENKRENSNVLEITSNNRKNCVHKVALLDSHAYTDSKKLENIPVADLLSSRYIRLASSTVNDTKKSIKYSDFSSPLKLIPSSNNLSLQSTSSFKFDRSSIPHLCPQAFVARYRKILSSRTAINSK